MGDVQHQVPEVAAKVKFYLKPFFAVVVVLLFCLSISGIAEAFSKPKISQDLFITILFFIIFCVFCIVFYLLLKHSGVSKYEISTSRVKKVKKDKKKEDKADLTDGVENAGFHPEDLEKGEPENGHATNGDLVKSSKEEAYYAESNETHEAVLVEKDESDNEEKGKKEEKWKENYVPYDESKESDKE